MKRLCLMSALLALGLGAGACTMPDRGDFQFECNWNDLHGEEDMNTEDLCPQDEFCRAGCCGSGAEEPVCHLLKGFGEEGASAAGASCTGGCADYSCKGTCPIEGNLSCLDEKSSGFPGGICTTPCANCDGFCGQPPGMQQTCVSQCERNEHCREGYRCDCSQPNQWGDGRMLCGCVPDCANSPGACGEGRRVDGSRCDGSTGRCYACLPSGQSCGEGSDCCSGNCCNGLCQDGACG